MQIRAPRVLRLFAMLTAAVGLGVLGACGSGGTTLIAATPDGALPPTADGSVDAVAVDAVADANSDVIDSATACKPQFAKCDNVGNSSQALDPTACGVAPYGEAGSASTPSCSDFCKANLPPGGMGECLQAPASAPAGSFVCSCHQA
jgi:hypothetical protein